MCDVLWCCKQARQQSVEEVNQRWAAKSHGLLSRISNLEHQLQGQGQSSDRPAASSPSAQVRTWLLVFQPLTGQMAHGGLILNQQLFSTVLWRQGHRHPPFTWVTIMCADSCEGRGLGQKQKQTLPFYLPAFCKGQNRQHAQGMSWLSIPAWPSSMLLKSSLSQNIRLIGGDHKHVPQLW